MTHVSFPVCFVYIFSTSPATQCNLFKFLLFLTPIIIHSQPGGKRGVGEGEQKGREIYNFGNATIGV